MSNSNKYIFFITMFFAMALHSSYDKEERWQQFRTEEQRIIDNFFVCMKIEGYSSKQSNKQRQELLQENEQIKQARAKCRAELTELYRDYQDLFKRINLDSGNSTPYFAGLLSLRHDEENEKMSQFCCSKKD